jgi:galactose mutarotase-like enzyme
MPDQPPPWVPLSSGLLTAAIDPRGAQLSVLKDRGGRDLLWGGEPAVWAGRAPLLFPIVGVLAGGAYRLGAKTYRLPRHGFARDKLFTIESATSASAVLRLRADEATFQVYPFRFELEVHVEITGPTLTVGSTVRNGGEEDLPASFGYHPALRWPLPFGQARAAHFVEFEVDETAPIRRIDAAGLLTPQRHPTPVAQRRLALSDALFLDDVMIFDSLQSRSAIYGAEEGPRISVSFPDARYLGIWTKPGAQFICIEPWHGVTDPEGFCGDFTEKPGVFIVPAGGEFKTTMALTLLE